MCDTHDIRCEGQRTICQELFSPFTSEPRHLMPGAATPALVLVLPGKQEMEFKADYEGRVHLQWLPNSQS